VSLSYPETVPLTERIIGLAIEVHRTLGPGLLESNYEDGLCIELVDAAIPHLRQPFVPVIYKGRKLAAYYKPDIIVDASVIVEVKSVEKIIELHKAQLLTYLRHTDLKVGLLFNFNTERLVDGIVRVSR
jgi:GxxExxY protein